MTRLYNQYKKTLPRVDGKVFAITGTTSGTGFVAAQTIAELGGEVVLLNRKSSRADAASERLQAAVPDGDFVPIECDLQDFASVRQAADEIKRRYHVLNGLANNAGIMATPDEATVDGYDQQMQTNHLSHFLLTAELYPLLQAAAEASGEARIVNHSSLLRHETPKKKLEEEYLGRNGGNLGGNGTSYPHGANYVRYHHSKLANAVFTYALHEKLAQKDSKIKAIAAHPGISKTSLFKPTSLVERALMPVFFAIMGQSSEDGSLGLLRALLDPNASSGVLYGPKPGKTYGPAVPNPPETYENDPASMQMLWEASEEATRKFDV